MKASTKRIQFSRLDSNDATIVQGNNYSYKRKCISLQWANTDDTVAQPDTQLFGFGRRPDSLARFSLVYRFEARNVYFEVIEQDGGQNVLLLLYTGRADTFAFET